MEGHISGEVAKEYVPGSTIARVFHELAFKKKTTEITQPTVILCGEYIRLFVQEAILRSNQQRLAELDEKRTQEDVKPESGPFEGSEVGEENEVADAEQEDDFDDKELGFRGLGVFTQTELDVPPVDTLETRHLAAISGLLLMDF